MNHYEAIVTREGENWLADVADLPGAHTYARSIPALIAGLKEVVVLMADMADDADVDIQLTFQRAPEEIRQAAELGRKREDLARQGEEIHRATSRAVQQLTAAGISARDVSFLLNLTPGRVSQLAHNPRTA